MANSIMKWAYRDGTNAPTDPINGYQVMNVAAEAAVGIEGDLLYTKDDKVLYLNLGGSHVPLYPHPAPPTIPTELPPAPLSIILIGPVSSYNLSNTNDVAMFYNPSVETIVNLHQSTTALRKRFDIKAWSGLNVRVRVFAGDSIDPGALTELVLTPPQSVTLVPITGFNAWGIV